MHLTLALSHPSGTLRDEVDISIRGEHQRFVQQGHCQVLIRVTVTDLLTVITVWPTESRAQRIRWICPARIVPDRWIRLAKRENSSGQSWECQVRLA